MHVMFSLLNFYKEMGREEIYIRYIYHLAELHKASQNWVEAANTLLLHAELLQWSITMQKQEGAFPRQTSAERKEALYDEIVTLFDKGKVGVASLFRTVVSGSVPCRIPVSVFRSADVGVWNSAVQGHSVAAGDRHLQL
jgi:hypothetical protein